MTIPEIKKMMEGITKGEWNNYGRYVRLNNDVHIASTEIEEDATFIAASPQIVAFLLGEVERLEREKKAYRSMLTRYLLKEVPLTEDELKIAQSEYDGKSGAGLRLFKKVVTDWEAIDEEASCSRCKAISAASDHLKGGRS